MSNRRSEATLVSSTRDLTLKLETVAKGGRLRCAMIRTGIWPSPGWSCRRGIRTAGQLHRNLDGQGSAGEQRCGGPARAAAGIPTARPDSATTMPFTLEAMGELTSANGLL